MTAPTMSPQFASAVERALEELPASSASRPVVPEHRTRAVVVTGVVAAVLVLITVAAIGLPAHHRPAPAAPTNSASVPGVASCTPEQVRPLSCEAFTVQRPSGGPTSFEAWIDVVDGQPRLVVGESERLRILPIELTRRGATAAAVKGWPPLQRSCSSDSDCDLDQVVERVFTGGATITAVGQDIRIDSRADSTTLLAKGTGRTHRYPEVGRVVMGGHVLMTYHDTGLHMTAAGGGTLSYNAAGCLTDGTRVLVLPDTTIVDEDGSIEIAGKHVPVGGELHLGGGEGPVPADQRCGTGNYFYGYGV